MGYYNPERAESQKDPAYLCKCGCGGYVHRLKSNYILGHHTRHMSQKTKNRIRFALRKYYETNNGKKTKDRKI